MKENRNGRWKQIEDDGGYFDWKCPECGWIYSMMDEYEPNENSLNYCPCCGTRLIGEEEDA